MQIEASIIIRCYNEERHIGRLLEGIAQQTLKAVEIIVVDSGSSDHTLAIVSRHPARVLHISPRRFSFGRSLNLGCSRARGRFLVLASAHVYPVFDDWLERLLEPLRRDPGLALVYGKQRGEAGSRLSERRVFEQWFPDSSLARQDHPFCNNANAALRRRLWQEMPYDEELTGLEDIDWARRAQARGYGIAYSAEAEVKHLHNETWPQVFKRYQREALALARIFPESRLGLGQSLALWAKHLAGDLAQARREGALAAHLGPVLAFRSMQFFGAYRGFRHRGPLDSRLLRAFYYPRRPQGESPPARSEARPIRYPRRPL